MTCLGFQRFSLIGQSHSLSAVVRFPLITFCCFFKGDTLGLAIDGYIDVLRWFLVLVRLRVIVVGSVDLELLGVVGFYLLRFVTLDRGRNFIGLQFVVRRIIHFWVQEIRCVV